VTERAPLSAALATVGLLSACGTPPSAAWSTTQADWAVAGARLAALRATEPRAPYGMVIRVTLREPRSGRTFGARGAVAVDPHSAMRMILLGPGGATALDAWVTTTAYRFEVPPLRLLRRGGTEGEARLPVDFFREWFLAPLEGRLLASVAGPSGVGLPDCQGQWFILRRNEATTIACEDERAEGLEIVATRRTPRAVERFLFHGTSLSPHPGDRAEYENPRMGVRATVEVESLDDAPPDRLAFVDPDSPASGGGVR
jgi:hypothetical protein